MEDPDLSWCVKLSILSEKTSKLTGSSIDGCDGFDLLRASAYRIVPPRINAATEKLITSPVTSIMVATKGIEGSLHIGFIDSGTESDSISQASPEWSAG